MAKPWGGAGAWAAEAERADMEKEKEIAARPPLSTDFPDLSTAATQQKQKKKKQQAMPLGALLSGTYVGPGGKLRSQQISDTTGLTPQEMMSLPTGPRDRSGEEPVAGALGGGFRDYGAYRGGGGGVGTGREEFSRDRAFGGGYEREERGGYGRDRDDGPSRADENDNWGVAKKFVPSGPGSAYGDDDRRPSRLSDRDLPSRADEVDNWGSAKKFVPTLDSRNSFRSDDGLRDLSSRADEVDNWGAAKKFVPSAPPSRGPGGGFEYREPGADTDRWSKREPVREIYDAGRSERPRLVLQPRTRPLDSSPPPPQVLQPDGSENKTPLTGEELDQELPPKPKPKYSPFGAARPREEVLAEKGLDWRKLEVERESTSRPSSSHSSRPQTPEVGTDGAARPRPKINPFGGAKPREVLLEEKGKDYRKIDFELEHRSVERAETAEETKLKDEIKELEELVKNSLQIGENGIIGKELTEGGESRASLQQQLFAKEKELERVTRDLDDRVRFSQRGDRSLRSGRPVGRSVSRERSSLSRERISRERISVSRERISVSRERS